VKGGHFLTPVAAFDIAFSGVFAKGGHFVTNWRDTSTFVLACQRGRRSGRRGLYSNPTIEENRPVNVGPEPVPKLTTGPRRFLFVAAGLVCVGLAYLGAVLPGLPTTPWVLLASYCFARSSPRLERWLKRSPFFGRLIHDWETHRGIRRPVKVLAILLVAVVVSASVVFGGLPVWVRWLIGSLATVGICVIVFVVPTIPKSEVGGQR
jgi:uncharacterized membrane protein YbaN (DUF454 family)